MTKPPMIGEVVGRLHEDVRSARDSFLFRVIGGSPFIPRLLRRLLFNLAGARLESAPGLRFSFAGSPANFTYGPGGYMNDQVFIEAAARVTIGTGSSLGMQSCIITSHHEIDGAGHWAVEASPRPVTIGDRVWVGARVLILPGSVIESDVILAGGAVVTGRCLAGGVYAGVPARRIRDFNETSKNASVASTSV